MNKATYKNLIICASLVFTACQNRTFQSEVLNSEQGPKPTSRDISQIAGNIEEGWNTLYAAEGGARYDCRAKIEIRDGNLFAQIQESNQLQSTRMDSGKPIDWKKVREFNFGPIPTKKIEGIEHRGISAFEFKANGNYFYAEFKKSRLISLQLASANVLVAQVNRIWCMSEADQ